MINIEDNLKNIIRKILVNKISNEELTEDSNLIDDFDMDSVQIIEMIVEIEKKFNIEFTDDDLDLEVLGEYKKLRDLVSKKIIVEK